MLVDADATMYEESTPPCGAIYRAKDMLDDSYFVALETIVDVPHPEFEYLKDRGTVYE